MNTKQPLSTLKKTDHVTALPNIAAALALSFALTACSTSNFGSNAAATQKKNAAVETPTATAPASDDAKPEVPAEVPAPQEVEEPAVSPPAVPDDNGVKAPVVTTPEGNFTACSTAYKVPARANPYLAGVRSGTTINYTVGAGSPTDTTQLDNPVQVAPIGTGCLMAGQKIYFSVSGMISHGGGLAATSANGNLSEIEGHQKGSLYGKSNITAPLNSLLGVFLGDGDPSALTAPEALEYRTQAARDYLQVAPKIGQVFFIGTGKTTAGVSHQVVVPANATRLFFAVMDNHQWNNNSGELTGSILKKVD